MMKFKESRYSITTELLLWREASTQVAVKETYKLKIYPVSSLYNEDMINFDIPGQPMGMMSNIDIITTFKVKKGAINMIDEHNCTVVNNFANSLWELVDVKLANRVDLMQSMRNSYASMLIKHFLTIYLALIVIEKTTCSLHSYLRWTRGIIRLTMSQQCLRAII